MALHIRNTIITLLLICFGPVQQTANARQDTTLVKSLLDETYFYNPKTSNYLPLIAYDELIYKTLHFKLERSDMPDALLKIGSNQELALFVNQKLVIKTQKGEDIILRLDSLFQRYGQSLQCAIYNHNLSAKGLTIALLAVGDRLTGEFTGEHEVVITGKRNSRHVFNNFLILGFIIVAGYLATLYNYYPRVTIDFLRFGRAVALREMDENLLKSRPFSWINFLFYAFFSLLSGYLLVSIFYLAPFELVDNFVSTWMAIWFWLKASGVILFWLLIKYLLVRNLTSLFNIKHFLASHYFNYIRIGLLAFLFSTGLMIISYLGFDITSTGYYNSLFTFLLVAVSIRAIFIMFKLMNSASYKFLHLFSYLCGTEIIPLGVILFLGFNQPF